MANNSQPPLNVASQMHSLKDQELLKKARLVDPDLRKFIARKALRSQVVRKQKSYYSTIRFPFNVTPVLSGGATTQWDFTIGKKKVIAFSYGVQDDATPAGFAKDFTATEAETNLIAKGEDCIVVNLITIYRSKDGIQPVWRGEPKPSVCAPLK